MSSEDLLADATTPDLVRAAGAGDRRAFSRLVVRYEARIRAVALAAGLDPAGAEDVAQDAFTAAWQHLPELKDPALFPAWTAGIARHRALSAVRRRGIEPAARADLARLPFPDAAADPATEAERESERESVRRALQSLDERERLALTLRHHAGLTYAEIAETMTLPVTTIKGLLYRGTKALKTLLSASREGVAGA